MEGHAATAIVLPLDLTNHLALIKRSDVTNIAGVSSRSKNRRAMRRWRSALARRRARPHSLRTILGATGDCRGRGGRGSASGVLAITRGPESKMSAAGAQSDSTRHSKYVRKLASTTATHVVILYRRGSAEKALRHLFEGVLPRNMTTL